MKGVRGVLIVTVAVLAWLGATPAFALNCDWQGGDGVDWTASVANWTCGAIPGAGDNVTIGTSDDVTVSTDLTVGSLSITGTNVDTILRVNSGKTLTVAGTLSVAGGNVDGGGTLVVNGTFTKATVNRWVIRLGSTVELRGDGSTVNGAIQTGEGFLGSGFLKIFKTFTLATEIVPDGTPGVIDTGNGGFFSLVGPDGKLVKDSPGLSQVGRIDNDGDATHGVDVVQGELEVYAGNDDAQTGPWKVASGSTLKFSGGGQVLNGSVSGTGAFKVTGGQVSVGSSAGFAAGSLELSGGKLVVADAGGTPVSIPAMVLSGGDRAGARPFTVGTLTWSAGNLENGPTTVTTGFTKTTASEVLVDLDATLTLNAPGSIAGGHICVGQFQQGSGALQVNNTLTIAAASDASPIQRCGNAGPVTIGAPNGAIVLANTTPKTIVNPVTNNGTLALSAGQSLAIGEGYTQNAGTTAVAQNAILATNATLNGGLLQGAGQVQGNVTNTSGTLSAGSSPGTLTITGNYIQGPGGTMAIDVNGTGQGTTFDLVQVTGSATLDGTLAITRDPAFDPANGDVFQFLTSASRSGTFANVTGTGLSLNRSFSADYPGSAPFGARLVLQLPSPPVAGTPQVTGTAAVGQTLTCDPGTWTGSPTFAFAWLRDGAAITGATASTYAVVDDDAAHDIACRVTGTNGGGSVAATSAAVKPPAQAPVNTRAPSVSGTAAPGQVLTCSTGDWTGIPAPSFAVQWLRDGAAIAGATGSTYTVGAADQGHTLSCRVDATNAGGSASATSPGVAVPAATLPPPPTPAPTTQEKSLAKAPASQVAGAFGLPSTKKCVSRRVFTIRLKQPRGVTIAKARVTVNGKSVNVRKVSGRFTAKVDLRGFPKGRFTVKITVTTASKLTLRGTRRYRTCTPKSGGGRSGGL